MKGIYNSEPKILSSEILEPLQASYISNMLAKFQTNASKHGLIVGVYESEHDQEVELTNVGKKIDERTEGKLSQNLLMQVYSCVIGLNAPASEKPWERGCGVEWFGTWCGIMIWLVWYRYMVWCMARYGVW